MIIFVFCKDLSGFGVASGSVGVKGSSGTAAVWTVDGDGEKGHAAEEFK